jgi:glycogen synthase
MRVLWWTGSFWPVIGGTQVFGAGLAERLQARGHEIVVLTDNEDDHLPEHDALGDVPIHRCAFIKAIRSGLPARVWDLHRRVHQILHQYNPDLVHLHSIGAGALFCALALARYRGQLLITKHELFGPNQPLGPDTLPAQLFTRADAVTCPSTAVLEDICRVFPWVRARAIIIHDGLPAPPVAPVPPSYDPPRLVCLGRLVRQKGMDLAIQALPRIRRRFPKARLVIVGHGPEQEALECQARQLGLADAVEFPGWVSPTSVPTLMRQASLILMPSRHAEGFGLVAVEAGHAERAVVASRIRGLDEAVVNGESGLLVAPEDPDALAAAVVDLLANPERATEMGRRGRERALTMCDLERCAHRYDQVYGQLAREGHREHNAELRAR